MADPRDQESLWTLRKRLYLRRERSPFIEPDGRSPETFGERTRAGEIRGFWCRVRAFKTRTENLENPLNCAISVSAAIPASVSPALVSAAVVAANTAGAILEAVPPPEAS